MTQIFVFIALGIAGADQFGYGVHVTGNANDWPKWYDGTTKSRDQWTDVFYRRIDDGPNTIHVYTESEALGDGDMRQKMDKWIIAAAREEIGRIS